MKEELDRFIEHQSKKGRGRLMRFKDEIEYLRNHGMTYAQITEFLKTKGVKISQQSVFYFCQKHIYKTSKTSPKPADENVNKSKTNKEENKETEPTNKNRRRVPAWATEIGGITSIDELI